MVSTRIAFAHILRGIAAGAVVVSHLTYLIWRKPDIVGGLIAYPPVAKLTQGSSFVPVTDFGLEFFWGYFGVALFFLISGFVIPFSVASMSRAGFAVARVLRIWPTYLVGLAVAVACIALNSALAGNAFPYSPLQILLNALIVPRWPTLTRSIDGIIWTLEIELFFYATCLILMPLIKRCDGRVFLLAALVVPLSYFADLGGGVLSHIGKPVYAAANWASTVPVYVCFMFCGTAFYYHYRRRIGTARLLGTQCFLLLMFVAAMRFGALAAQGWAAPISYLAAYGAFALSYFARARVAALPAWVRQPFERLADISYPLYAVHGVLGYTILVHAIEAGAPAWASVALAAASVLSVAVVVHHAVEMPSQACGKSLAAKIGRPDESGQSDPGAMAHLNIETTQVAG